MAVIRVPHLLQYVSSRPYFASIKVRRKIICESLDQPSWPPGKCSAQDARVPNSCGFCFPFDFENRKQIGADENFC